MAEQRDNATARVEYQFDGKGTVTITEKLAATETPDQAVTMPYGITPEGGLTIGSLSGQLSVDGQVIVLTATNAAEEPTLLVGVKGNLQTTNSVFPYQGGAITSTLTGTTIGPVPETLGKGCIVSENGNTAIGLDPVNQKGRGIWMLLSRKDEP